MSEPTRHALAVLAVGSLGDAPQALADRGVTTTVVSDASTALDRLDAERYDCVLAAADVGALSGVELAGVVEERVGVPTVVVGEDVPDVAAEAAGVGAVCSSADGERVTAAVRTAAGGRPEGALSQETIDALEELYELDGAGQSVESWLTAVAAIGCRRLGLPYGFVTRIEDGRQEVVAATGDADGLQPGDSAPLSESYCKYTVQSDDIVGFSDIRDADWVDDAAFERFGLSCYLGGRIELDDLYGTICFADRQTRSKSFSAEEQTFVKLLTQWVRYELSRRERRSELHLKNRVMDEAEMGITISDPSLPDHPIVYANEGFERVTGYPSEAVVGRNCRFLQGEDTDPETVARIRDAIEAEESVTVELRNYRKDGTPFWNRLQINPITADGEVVNFVGFQRDVTDRKERQQELQAYETAVDTAADAIYRLDAEGRFRMVSDAVCSMTGYDRADLLGEPLSMLLPDDEDAERCYRRIAAARRRDERDVFSLTMTVAGRDGTTFPAETRVALLTEDGDHHGTVLVTRDVSDRRAHERTLTELHDVSRSLLTAEDSRAISETIVAAADEILDMEVTTVYRFDERANRLRPAASSGDTEALFGELPTFDAGDGIAWEVFVSGERRLYDDVSTAPDAYNPETPIRAELLIPIGDHGLLLCGSTAAGVFDERTGELADLLAANAQAAYDRMEREQRLHRRERELREQNSRLERLDDINDRVRRITHELVGATTPSAVAERVCDGLAGVDHYKFVWVGQFDHADGQVRSRAFGGVPSGYLDALTFDPGDDAEPTVRAAMDGEPEIHNRVADGLRRGEWNREALSRDYRAVASVPLRHGGVPYGALSVYADEADAFDEETRRVLADLAETAAYSMAAAEQRQALLSDDRVELVFGLGSQPTTMFTLAESLGGRVTVSRLVPRSDGGSLLYGAAEGVSAEAFERECRESHGVTDAQVTGIDDDGLQFELHVTGPFVGTTVVDDGGSFTQFVVEEGRGRLVATFPSSASVSAFTRQFIERYDGAQLLARREQGAADPEPADATARLTERQREALLVAHERGFYDWPRESTGEEIAASLDITAPTFLEHLRRAEAKLVDSVVGGARTPDDVSVE